MISGIYKIENKITGKIYIGSAINIKNRWNKHKSMLNRNKHTNKKLQNSWNKYNKNDFNFIILEKVETGKLLEREQYYIDKLNPFFNHRKQASSNLGVKLSEETKRKMSESRLKYYSENPNSKEKLSKYFKNNPTKYWSGKISPRNGVKLSEETKRKMSESRKGINTGENHPRARSIIQLDLNNNIIKEYNTVKQAQEENGFRGISKACINNKVFHGYKWNYK